MAYKPTCPTLAKVPDDEPIFVLRASDQFAPRVVEYWCGLAHAQGVNVAKVKEAERCVQTMVQWQNDNGRKLPD